MVDLLYVLYGVLAVNGLFIVLALVGALHNKD